MAFERVLTVLLVHFVICHSANPLCFGTERKLRVPRRRATAIEARQIGAAGRDPARSAFATDLFAILTPLLGLFNICSRSGPPLARHPFIASSDVSNRRERRAGRLEHSAQLTDRFSNDNLVLNGRLRKFGMCPYRLADQFTPFVRVPHQVVDLLSQ